MLLKRGYYGLGIQDVLRETGTPKGSFYHHFDSKEDFAHQVVDSYMETVHDGLDMALKDQSRTPLERARQFFELTREKYRQEGYMGCLLGGLGQELSGVNESFRQRIEDCLSEIARRISLCLDEACRQGELPPDTDTRLMADLLVDCWEGAALRTRLRRDPAPLGTVLDFYFQAARRA